MADDRTALLSALSAWLESYRASGDGAETRATICPEDALPFLEPVIEAAKRDAIEEAARVAESGQTWTLAGCKCGKWNCTFGCRWPLSVYASRPRTCSECTKYAIRLALNLPAPSPSDGSDAAREKREEGQGA